MSEPLDPLDVARALRTALAKLNRRLRARDELDGVGSTGMSLLGRLFRGGPSTAAALAAQERLKPQSLTRTLAALEARKLIAREADETDRRRSTITVTIAGVKLLRSSVRNRESWLYHAMESALSQTERDLIRIAIPLLDRLADAEIEEEEET